MEYSFVPFMIVLGLSLLIGALFSKTSKKSDDYFLGNRGIGWFPLAMTFIATQIGGGCILGTAEAAYDSGICGIFYSLGGSLGFLTLGLGYGALLRSLEVRTMVEIFEKFYQSTALKKGASLLSIFSLTGILIAQAVGLKKFLFTMGLQEDWIFFLIWFCVIFYTTQGGFLAVVWTDTLQAVIMLGMLLITFFSIFQTQTTAISKAIALPEHIFSESTAATLLSYLITPFLFTFLEQDLAQRCFSGKSTRDVTLGALIASVILFVFACIPTYFGMKAKALGISSLQGSTFLEVIIQLAHPVLASCAATAVLLAVISTASSLLCAAASNVTQDFQTNEKKESPWKLRFVSMSLGVLALAGSYLSSNIFYCIVASYELFIDSLFVPILAALFFKERARTLLPGALLAIICGSIGFAIEKSVSLGIFGLFFPLLLSACGFLIGGYFIKQPHIAKEAK